MKRQSAADQYGSMKPNETNKHNVYSRNLQYAFSISLLICILLFFSFQKFRQPNAEPVVYIAPQLLLMEIPPTTQPKKAGPPPSKPVIPTPADEIEQLQDVPIELAKGDNLADSSSTQQFIEGLPLETQPRQIIEVVPQNPGSEISGEIILLLRIGQDGRMKDYRLVSNSTRNEKALSSALQAARRSQWEATKVNGQIVEYWIEKIYRFNL